jgi:DNA-binding IscR family transcriptional regulator
MLPKTAEYALRAVVWLARKPQQTESADRLAEATKVPRRYLHNRRFLCWLAKCPAT